MINPFYLGGMLWAIVLFCYELRWSDLCRPLEPGLLAFILVLIASLFVIGFLFRDVLTFSREVTDFKDARRLTALICIVLLSGMIIHRSVPLLSVFQGKAYNTQDVGTPLVGTFFTALALWQSFRLSLAFELTRSKSAFRQLGLIFLILLLCVQRQNIMVWLVGVLCAIWVCRRRKQMRSLGKRLRLVFLLLVVIAVALFVFGAIGNARYGLWSWDDSSMISALGYLNSRYPNWLPKEYFWAYIYVVTPLANLNNNIVTILPSGETTAILSLLIPSSIGERLLPGVLPSPYLIQPSLTVCTSYVNSYLLGGYSGMLLFMMLQQLLMMLVMAFAVHEKGDSKYAGLLCVAYYIAMTIFDNPSTYLITSYMSIVVVAHRCWRLVRKKKRIVSL